MLEQTFESMQVSLADPNTIRDWSRGEVKKPETINYRTLKPERDGLFCERIFGPIKDWECHCGKYKKNRYQGVVCDRCGVEVTRAKVRRERMGHIELAAPVSHIWYFKGVPSRIGVYLDITPRNLERILYFASYVVTGSKVAELEDGMVLSDKEYKEYKEKYGDKFRAGMGAEAIKELLMKIDIKQLAESLREEYEGASVAKKQKVVRRLEVVEAFMKSGNKPEWMVLDVIPVIPPDIRPMVQLDGGRFATSDLNDLYRRVINRNNRLQKLLDLGAPEIIVRNEKRMLQEAVDALIDNGRRGRPVTGPGNRALKSLSDMLKGKQGRFRQNLLGKRVDYSGRSVIVVGPELKLHQCGLPKEMALELFKPFVMRSLVDNQYVQNIKAAKRKVEKQDIEVWDVLDAIISDHPVLLNRAPTLHRLGIQAFEPVLVEGRALKLHPLVCTAYNADFDGDQMAIHVPLSVEAQSEARFLMLAANNLLKPQDGKPVTVPTQDMVLGAYYLTMLRENEKGAGKIYSSVEEALLAYNEGDVGLHAPIKVLVNNDKEGKDYNQVLIDATVGRLIFNAVVPQDLGFVDRTQPENEHKLEVEFMVDKKKLGKIVAAAIEIHGLSTSAVLLDNLKTLGFKYSTRGAITVSVSDMEVPDAKQNELKKAEKEVDKIRQLFRRGLLTDDERYRQTIDLWAKTKDNVTKALMEHLDIANPIYMMANSGARGSIAQIAQLSGMRGLMANTKGETMEIPVRANFREGLNVLEYFISSHGARKGLADTALRTADSGYLTRRLVDVSQDVIIRERDCGTSKSIVVANLADGDEVIEELEERLVGRFLNQDVKISKAVTYQKGELVTPSIAKIIAKSGIEKVEVRSPLTCQCKHGICAKCYGANLATGVEVRVGEAVGIIAAQSIGEPGTQLTMRTFHTGGVAGDDITQGLPRVEELFEARKPKGLAIISEISGVVSFGDNKKKREVWVTDDESKEAKSYFIPFGLRVKVSEGDVVEPGTELTYGSVNPHDILRVNGVTAVQNYLAREVQRVYRLQGVDINDRHIEVIVRQMLKKAIIEDAGDTGLLNGQTIDVSEVSRRNDEIERLGKEKAVYQNVIMGITKASLATDSFLSAASFQETTRVLTDAAIKSKVDPLIGLKENVIIGKLIPAGTGLPVYDEVGFEVLNAEGAEVDYSSIKYVGV